jgi:adenylyl-sulfate kinase
MMEIYEKNLVHSSGIVNKHCRAEKLKQKPCCIWLTGLSGAGKSTLAYATEYELHKKGKHVYVLDGDNIRYGLNSDLGFSDVDRIENIRRVTEVARLMVDAGLIVIVSFISPFKNERLIARNHFEIGEFFEVFVDAPLSVCEQRDVKGLYKKARGGDIPFFTGISSSYELPEHPELHLKTDEIEIAESIDNIIKILNEL